MKTKALVIIGLLYALAALTGCASRSNYDYIANGYNPSGQAQAPTPNYAAGYLLFQQMQANEAALNYHPAAPMRPQVVIQAPAARQCNLYTCPDYYK